MTTVLAQNDQMMIIEKQFAVQKEINLTSHSLIIQVCLRKSKEIFVVVLVFFLQMAELLFDMQ